MASRLDLKVCFRFIVRSSICGFIEDLFELYLNNKLCLLKNTLVPIFNIILLLICKKTIILKNARVLGI